MAKGGAAASYAAILERALRVIDRADSIDSSGYIVQRECRAGAERLAEQAPGHVLASNFDFRVSVPLADAKVAREPDSGAVGLWTRVRRNGVAGFEQTCALELTIDRENGDPRESCCFAADRKVVARRFHFDLSNNTDDWPSSHVQYGGDPAFVEGHYCMHPHLETPRIPSAPVDFVLLFDLVVSQFETPLSRFAKTGEWKSVVLQAENFWLDQYYKDLSRALRSANRKKEKRTLYEDLCRLEHSFG